MKKFFPVLSRDKASSSAGSSVNQEVSTNQHSSETQPKVPPNSANGSIKVVDYELLETDPRIRPPISSYHPDIQDESYQLAEDLGRNFSERAILKTFMEVESALPASSLKNVLGLLRWLYALISVGEDAAFLRYGYLSTENASAVRKDVPKLYAEL